MNNLGFLWWNDDDKIDIESLSEDKLRLKADQGLKFFWQELVHDGLTMSFNEFISYIDKLHPTYRNHLGKQIYYAERVDLNTDEIFTKIGKEAKGRLPADSVALQVFAESFIEDLDSISMKGKWIFNSVTESVKDIGTSVKSWYNFVSDYKTILLFGGLALIGLKAYHVLLRKK